MITAAAIITEIYRQQQEELGAAGALPPEAKASDYGQEWTLTLVNDPEQVRKPAGPSGVHRFPVASLDEGITALHLLSEALADYPTISSLQVCPLQPGKELFLVVYTRVLTDFEPGHGKGAGY